MAKKQLTIEEKLQAALVPVEEQPYKVPENWCWVRLDKLYQVNPKNEDVDEDTRAAFIPMANIDGGLTSNFTYEIQSWKQAKKGHTQMADGDVAFAKISPCFENRKSMIVEGLENGIGGGTTELIILRQPNVNKEYTFWLVSTEEFISKGCTTYSGTVGQQRISMDFVKNYPVPLAPLNEQSRIVARIESLFAKLDEAKEKIQEVLDGADLRRAAILHQAFTGKLTTIKNADDVDGIFPSIRQWGKDLSNKDRKILIEEQDKSEKIHFQDGREWIKCTIGAIGRVSNGSTPSRKCPNYWDGNIFWVSSGEVSNNVITNTKERITQEGYENSSVKLLPVGTVLIAMIGEGKTRGQSAILDIEATTNQNIAAVIINHGKVLPKFLWFWFQFNYTKNREKGAGSGPQALNCQRVRELEFVCPSVREQKEIVRLLDNLLSREQSTVTACEEALTTIDILKKSILARAFRGELGTNDPSEAGAQELLQEILAS